MSGPVRRTAIAAALGAIAVTACSSAAAQQPQPEASLPPAVTTPLASTLVTGQGAWAVLVMGGKDNFWQVFAKPAGAAGWSLATPPGVADNGGLVAAGTGGQLLVGFRPSADLAFSPLADSGDAGKTWTQDVLDKSLASVPDALATAPSGQQAALLTDSTIQTKTPGAAWGKLATVKDLQVTAPGQKCGVRAVSAVAFWDSTELAAGADCTRPGVAGIFVRSGGGWLASGPTLPGAYANMPVRVLRLGDQTALLQAGGDLLATWGQTVSAPLPGGQGQASLPGGQGQASLSGGQVQASGFGAGQSMWVLLSDGRAATIRPGGGWQLLPRPPAGTAVLSTGQGPDQALAAAGSILTVWQLSSRQTWVNVQTIRVPINYGSSS
jgi:hypothetical protein